MKRGQNSLFSAKYGFQHPRIQKHKANREEPGDRENVSGNGQEKSRENGFNGPVVAFIAFRFSDNRRRDLDGATATVADALVHAGILADDDTQRITSICATSVKVAKGQEGVDIMLMEVL